MPIINLKSIYNVSSEDPLFPARNLLSSEVKKWKCRTAGESSAYVTIQLEKSTLIQGIDIGNEHSTFIVVLVAKNGSSNEDFKEILLTSSFMTPMECRNSENINRVRCFAKNALIESVAKEKWDLIKFLCTQPFNKHVKYGLSFIKIHTNNEEIQNEEITNNTLTKHNKTPIDGPSKNLQTIGKFKLRKCSSDSSSENEGSGGSSLFQRWKESMNGNLASPKTPLNSAAAIREASSSPSLLAKQRKNDNNTNNSKLITPTVVSSSSPSTIKNVSNDIEVDVNKESTPTTLNRNRTSLFYADNDIDDEKSNSKFEKKLTKDREEFEKNKKIVNHQEKQQSNIKKNLNNKMDSSVKKFNTFVDDNQKKNSIDSVGKPSQSLSTTKKRPLSPTITIKHDEPNRKVIKTPTINNEMESIAQPQISKPLQYKPFNCLLENIVFTISGIQNPDRAKIRQRGLEMGAKYKQDWDSNCTHLICAFKNTPKYNQVRGHGKIVKKDWILNCHTKRKRLQWRKFALDESEASGICSDEEIIDITMKPKDTGENKNIEKEHKCSTKTKSPPITIDNQKSIDDANDDDVEIINKPVEKYIISSDDSESDDTEDEIEKINKNKKDIFDVTTEEEENLIDNDNTLNDRKLIKPLPNLFENLKFYLQTTKDADDIKKIKRLISIYKGVITDNLTEANYLIVTNAADRPSSSSSPCKLKDFDKFNGKMLKSQWIVDCNDAEKLLPTNKYRI